MIKFNSILKFIIHLFTIYNNPMFTVYLISVSLGGLGEDALALIKCCWVAKVQRNSFMKLKLGKAPSRSLRHFKTKFIL